MRAKGESRPKGAVPVSTGSTAALAASASAPFIWSDIAPCAFGHSEGTVHVTLEAYTHTMPGYEAKVDAVTVAHLRMPLSVAKRLREALQACELLAVETSGKSN